MNAVKPLFSIFHKTYLKAFFNQHYFKSKKKPYSIFNKKNTNTVHTKNIALNKSYFLKQTTTLKIYCILGTICLNFTIQPVLSISLNSSQIGLKNVSQLFWHNIRNQTLRLIQVQVLPSWSISSFYVKRQLGPKIYTLHLISAKHSNKNLKWLEKRWLTWSSHCEGKLVESVQKKWLNEDLVSSTFFYPYLNV